MNVGPRDAFWIWAPERSIHHLTVVLTHPELRTESGTVDVALVNVSSIRRSIAYDGTTPVSPEDYPSKITHPSYVFYQKAQFKSVQEIEDETRTTIPGTNARYAVPLEPVSPAFFERICDGIQKSDDTPEEVMDYCFDRHPGDGTVTVGLAEKPKSGAE